MAVSIDEVEVETGSDSAPANETAAQPTKPDPREIERALNARRERLARVHAD